MPELDSFGDGAKIGNGPPQSRENDMRKPGQSGRATLLQACGELISLVSMDGEGAGESAEDLQHRFRALLRIIDSTPARTPEDVQAIGKVLRTFMDAAGLEIDGMDILLQAYLGAVEQMLLDGVARSSGRTKRLWRFVARRRFLSEA